MVNDYASLKQLLINVASDGDIIIPFSADYFFENILNVYTVICSWIGSEYNHRISLSHRSDIDKYYTEIIGKDSVLNKEIDSEGNTLSWEVV